RPGRCSCCLRRWCHWLLVLPGLVVTLVTASVPARCVGRSSDQQRGPAAGASTYKSHCVLLIVDDVDLTASGGLEAPCHVHRAVEESFWHHPDWAQGRRLARQTDRERGGYSALAV